MRRFFYALGVLALVVIVVAGVGVGVAFYKGSRLDAESRAFVDGAVPAITAHWNKEQLRKRASPQLLQSLKPGQLTALFAMFSRLGPLIEYEGAKGQARMFYKIGSGGTVSASYVAKARYRNGSAAIKILLIEQGRDWLIQGFHIDLPPSLYTGRGA
ncbi:MAG: hypothetical protein ACREE4_15340 [Stellaceae bacterium]